MINSTARYLQKIIIILFSAMTGQQLLYDLALLFCTRAWTRTWSCIANSMYLFHIHHAYVWCISLLMVAITEELVSCHFFSPHVLWFHEMSCHFMSQDLQGVIAGREFVWWYNGHPDYKDFQVDLTSSDTAIILGQVSIYTPTTEKHNRSDGITSVYEGM